MKASFLWLHWMQWQYVPDRGVPERWVRSVPERCVQTLDHIQMVDNHNNSFSQKLGFPRVVHWGHLEKPKLRSTDPAYEPHHVLPAHGTDLINLCRNNVRSHLCKEWIVSGYIVQGTHCPRKKSDDGLTLKEERQNKNYPAGPQRDHRKYSNLIFF